MCDCLEQWTIWMRCSGQSPRTIRLRLGTVQRTARPTGACACKITTMDMVASLDRKMSAWSRTTYVGCLRAWGRWLTETRRREHNPALALPRPRQPKVVPRPIGEADIVRLFDQVTGRELVMITLGAYAGLRRCEIAAFRGEDVDEDALYVEGKGGVCAMVPTHPRVWALAQQMPATGWWFPSPIGDGALSPHTVGLLMGRAMAMAGVKGTPHQLRHRYGTAVLRSSGGNLRVAQELLRHASPSTTAGYTLIEDADKRAAVHALA